MDKNYPLKLYELNSSGEIVNDGILTCSECNRFYPIKDKIPIMLPDNLRDKNKDFDFLQKWEKDIPKEILENINHINLKNTKQ